jgi:hypothetical protein
VLCHRTPFATTITRATASNPEAIKRTIKQL